MIRIILWTELLLGYVYNKDYYRDVLYRSFSNETTKMNCDYKIMINNVPIYVEIDGIIYNCLNKDWHNHEFASKQENQYRDKMIIKEQRLIENNCNYIFLFRSEMINDKYKEILTNKINEIIKDAA